MPIYYDINLCWKYILGWIFLGHTQSHTINSHTLYAQTVHTPTHTICTNSAHKPLLIQFYAQKWWTPFLILFNSLSIKTIHIHLDIYLGESKIYVFWASILDFWFISLYGPMH